MNKSMAPGYLAAHGKTTPASPLTALYLEAQAPILSPVAAGDGLPRQRTYSGDLIRYSGSPLVIDLRHGV